MGIDSFSIMEMSEINYNVTIRKRSHRISTGPGEVPLIRKLVVVLRGRVTGYRTPTLPQLTCFGALIAAARSFHLLDNETTYARYTRGSCLFFSLQSRTHVITLFIRFATSIRRYNIFQQLFSFFKTSSYAAQFEFWSERETGKIDCWLEICIFTHTLSLNKYIIYRMVRNSWYKCGQGDLVVQDNTKIKYWVFFKITTMYNFFLLI